MQNYIESGECVVVVYLCVMGPLCGKVSVWHRFWFHIVCGTSAGRGPLDFCKLVDTLWPPHLGWRHERTIMSVFTAIWMIFQYRRSETYRYTEGEKFATPPSKTQNTLKALASSSDFSSSYSSTYVTEWWHILLRRIQQRLPALGGYKYKSLLNEVAVVSKATIAAGILGSYSCDRLSHWVDEWGNPSRTAVSETLRAD